LLLVVLDLFAQGRISSNLIEITPELGELFAGYWSKVMPPERRGNPALPFFHLRSSGFWRLLPQPGQEAALQAVRQVDTLKQLSRLTLGACLDDELYQLLQVPESRNALRTYSSKRILPANIIQPCLNWVRSTCSLLSTAST
jgi:putative restriction endonuclease